MSIVILILCCICVFGSAVLIIARVLANSGVKVPFLPAKINLYKTEETTFKEIRNVFLLALLFRIIMLIACIFAFSIAVENGNEFTFSNFAGALKKWDANAYISISDNYFKTVENGRYTLLAFFPLYPFFIKLLNFIIPSKEFCAVTVSIIAFAFAAVFVYKLVCIDYSKQIAKLTLVLISVYPFAFYYGGMMTESTFLLTTAMTLYFIRKHNWLYAGIAGMFAALSRNLGVFLIFPATVELAEHYKIFSGGAKHFFDIFLKKWLWLLLMPLGTCIYLYINYYVSGDPLEFLALQKDFWHEEFIPFFKAISDMWKTMSGTSYPTYFDFGNLIPSLVFAFGIFAAIIYGVRKQRSMYVVWALIYVVMTTSISWPLSFPRYYACMIPVFIALAEICDKRPTVKYFVVCSFAVFLGIMLTGYLMGKQIM